MYRNLDYFKDIHILAKIFSLIIYILGIVLLQNSIFLLLLAGFFFILFRNIYTFGGFLLFFGLSFWNSNFMLLAKLFMIFPFFLLNLFTIHFQEIRQFIEYFSYHKKQSKISYLILYLCYFCKYYSIYFKEFLSYRKNYGKHLSISFLEYVITQSFYKTKTQIDLLMKTYWYRFYNSSNKRTYMEKNTITVFDLKYILCFVLLFLVIYIWGRG